jgi:hypothetical protein
LYPEELYAIPAWRNTYGTISLYISLYAVDESAMCAGSSQVISIITSIYTAYTASVASAQSVTEACSRSAAAAAASASATAAAPPSYHRATCDLHIREASYNYAEPLYVKLNIADDAHDLLARCSTFHSS